MAARPMEEAIADEAARVREEMNVTMPLVDKDERKKRDETFPKASVEGDWQGMVALDPAFYLKDNG